MNILLDFLTVCWKNGGGEWTRRVYFELFRQASLMNDIHFFALWDSKEGIAYEDMRQESLGAQMPVTYVDIQGRTLPAIIQQYDIHRFFIAMSMVYGNYNPKIDLAHVQCEVFCVTHDGCDEEIYYNNLDYYYRFIDPKQQRRSVLRQFVWLLLARYGRLRVRHLDCMQRVMAMVNNNPNVHMIAVSDYTKRSMQYNFGLPESKIQVLWSPERIYADAKEEIENPVLRDLIQGGKRFYLLIHANRVQKNPYKVVKAFEKFAQLQEDKPMLLALKYQESCPTNIVAIPWLSDSDLANAYKHCYALIYPSFFEGFGYPPLEAMHYAKPVLCSYSTSMPDIYENAPIYFCPLYETAVFEALLKLKDSNYAEYAMRSELQYQKVSERQQADLDKLVKQVLKQ